MAKRKSTTAAGSDVEPQVIKLAEQLGTLLGRAQRKADGWLESEALRKQLTQIRDGAAGLLKQVGKAPKAKAPATPKRRASDKVAAKTAKGRSGGVVDAPGKRHRRPPPHELFDPRLGEPMGKQMGQKHLKRRGRG